MTLTDRPTADLVVLLVAGTICFAVAALAVGLVVLALARPEVDNGPAVAGMSASITALLGLVGGYFAGTNTRRRSHPAEPLRGTP